MQNMDVHAMNITDLRDERENISKVPYTEQGTSLHLKKSKSIRDSLEKGITIPYMKILI